MSQYRISTGRGGAGNIHYSNEKISSPKIIPEGSQTPNIISPIYSTGRGGAGNMRRNIDPTITRKSQDVGDIKKLHNNNNNKLKNKKKLKKKNNHLDTIDDDTIITDLDIINQPFIESLESNPIETNALYVSKSTNNNHTDEDAILLDEDDYITPITNQDLFEENNKVSTVLSNIRSHISPMTSHEHTTPTQLDKVKFIDTKQNVPSQNSNNNKLRLVKTISHSKNDGTIKTVKMKKNRRKSSHNNGSNKPPPIVIGRGGAGNIVSPITTTNSHSPSTTTTTTTHNNNNNNTASNNNNIQSQNNEKKKSFLSSIINIFA